MYNTWEPTYKDGIAILANIAYSTDIQSNDISRISSVGIFLSRNGFGINTSLPTTQNIRQNTFRECGALAIQATDNFSALIDIRNNTIRGNSLLTTRPSYGGIFIAQNASVIPTGSVFVHSNDIHDVNFGVRVTNQTNVSVSNNIIELNDAPLDNNVNRFAGILLEECVPSQQNQGALAEFNTIRMMPNYVPDPSNIWSNVGIEVVNSPAANVIANLTQKVGRGLWFSGRNNRTTLSCNEIVDAEIGWVQVYSDGIGNQGNPYGPNDNQWRFPNNLPFIAHTYTDNDFNNQAGNKNIYHQTAPAHFVPTVNNNGINSTSFTAQQVISGTSNCTGAGADLHSRAEKLRNMAANTPEQQSFKGGGQMNLLAELRQNNLTDPDLIAYRDSLNLTSTALSVKILEKVQTNELDTAVVLCAGLTCANPSEHDLKMTVPLLQKVNANISLLPSEMIYLEDLAFSLPAIKGPAVHIARQILRNFPTYTFEWFNRGSGIQTNTANKQMTPITEEKTTPNISISPNPATDMLEIKGFTGTYTLLDLMGKIVKSGETQGDITVSELPRGLYVLTLGNQSFKVVLK